MPKPNNLSAARNKAQNHFTATERRDTAFRVEVERQQEARNAKNAKLRALRLAKEEADKIEAEKAAALKAQEKPPVRPTRKKKPATAK